MRQDWDSYFLTIAEQVATRATCNRLMVGTVLVKDNMIISTGYNGSIHNHEHCTDVGCLLNDQGRCIRTIHSEQNAILHADRSELKGATAYVTHFPCETCAKLLAQVGIVRIVYRNDYKSDRSISFLKGIELIHKKG